MNLKRMVEMLGNDDIEYEFYKYNDNRSNQEIAYIRVMSEDEEIVYRSLDEKSKRGFISNSAKIYLPDTSVYNFASEYKSNDRFSYKRTIDNLKKIIGDFPQTEEKENFAAYVILHEVGHWIHFESMGKKTYSYENEDIRQRKKVHNNRLKLQKEINFKDALSDNDERKIIDWINQYNSIPIEKRANKYANENILGFIKKLKE